MHGRCLWPEERAEFHTATELKWKISDEKRLTRSAKRNGPGKGDGVLPVVAATVEAVVAVVAVVALVAAKVSSVMQSQRRD